MAELGPTSGKAPRYAEGTEVDVQKSRAEVERLLQKHKADQCLTGSDYQTRSGFVAFSLRGKHYRFNIPVMTEPRPLSLTVEKWEKRLEQLERERWRSLVLILKAKLELIRTGMATAEQEFLAQLVLPDGTLLADQLQPRIEKMYATGKMLPLLPRFKQLGTGEFAQGELED